MLRDPMHTPSSLGRRAISLVLRQGGVVGGRRSIALGSRSAVDNEGGSTRSRSGVARLEKAVGDVVRRFLAAIRAEALVSSTFLLGVGESIVAGEDLGEVLSIGRRAGARLRGLRRGGATSVVPIGFSIGGLLRRGVAILSRSRLRRLFRLDWVVKGFETFLVFTFPVSIVAFEGYCFEVVEGTSLRSRDSDQLIFDASRETSSKLGVEGSVVPSCVRRVFGEFEEVLSESLVVLHLKGANCALRREGQVGIAEVSIELCDEEIPIVTNRRSGNGCELLLPPREREISEVRRGEIDSLPVRSEFSRLAVEDHYAAGDKGSKLARVPSVVLIRPSDLRFLVVLLVVVGD